MMHKFVLIVSALFFKNLDIILSGSYFVKSILINYYNNLNMKITEKDVYLLWKKINHTQNAAITNDIHVTP
jgi:hypothetical protein